MNWPRIILIAVAIIILLGLGWWLFFAGSDELVPGPGTTGEPFGPPAGQASTNITQPNGTVVTTIVLTNSQLVSTPDLTSGEHPVPVREVGAYQIAGSAQSAFDILFFPADSFFQIALLAEPIGATRLAAEQALRARTGLANQEICLMNSWVSVPRDINSAFAGRNLGFSFCPGATKLPE